MIISFANDMLHDSHLCKGFIVHYLLSVHMFMRYANIKTN
jgi:hypothetical protein